MAKKLQSKLFRNAATLEEKFYEHLSALWDLSPTKQTKLLKHLPKIVQSSTAQERQILEQDAVKALGGDATKASQTIRVLEFFAAQWNPFRDSVNDVLKDVQKLGLFPDDATKRNAAENFLRKYFKFLEEDSGRRKKKVFAGGTLPSLRSVDAIIDYRVVVDSNFDWQKDNPAKYQPSCSTTVPVIIVRITRDEGDPLIFQCEPEEIEMLIRQFQATLKEYQKSKNLLK